MTVLSVVIVIGFTGGFLFSRLFSHIKYSDSVLNPESYGFGK